jgi:hypothetical protein
MLVLKVADVETEHLSIKKAQYNKYLQIGPGNAVIQSPWITLGRYPLPNKQYVKEPAESISLTVPVEYGGELYTFFDNIDKYLLSNQPQSNGKLHHLVKTKDDYHYVNVKLYKETTLLIDKTESKVSNVSGWYDILEEGMQVRMLFGFTKLWNLNGSFGFSVRVNKIQVRLGESVKKPAVREDFTDD